MSLKGFHIVFIIFSTLLALALGAWCLWVESVEGNPVYLGGAIGSFAAAVALDHLRHLVLSKNETAPHHHMKARITCLLFVSRALRWPGDGLLVMLRREGWERDRAHGGRHLVFVCCCHVGPWRHRRVQFHIWRHASTPLEPHQQLTEEDFEQYE